MTAARRKSVIGVLAALTLLAATTACSTVHDDNEILVYNAQHEALTRQWADAFTAETGIEVTLRNGSDTELADQIAAEGDRSPADVFFTENSPAMASVDNAGLLADLDQATLAQIPEQYRPSTGRWTGVAANATAFVYNSGKLPADQLPASLLDLQQPQWQGRWTAATSGADFQAVVAGLLASRGEDVTRAWLRGMKANVVASQNNVVSMKKVDGGRADGGVIAHYYWYRDQAGTRENSGHTALHYFRDGDPGAFVSISGGGVLRSSKKSEAAQRFVRFVTGRTGQQVLQRSTSMEYPVAADVPANPALPPLDSLQAPRIDPSKLDSKKVTQLMTEADLL